ncbi:hypothetical protein EK904_011901, partial [Melospiza melodia maxima]
QIWTKSPKMMEPMGLWQWDAERTVSWGAARAGRLGQCPTTPDGKAEGNHPSQHFCCFLEYVKLLQTQKSPAQPLGIPLWALDKDLSNPKEAFTNEKFKEDFSKNLTLRFSPVKDFFSSLTDGRGCMSPSSGRKQTITPVGTQAEKIPEQLLIYHTEVQGRTLT